MDDWLKERITKKLGDKQAAKDKGGTEETPVVDAAANATALALREQKRKEKQAKKNKNKASRDKKKKQDAKDKGGTEETKVVEATANATALAIQAEAAAEITGAGELTMSVTAQIVSAKNDTVLKDNAQPIDDALKDDALKDGAQNVMALRADEDHKALAAQPIDDTLKDNAPQPVDDALKDGAQNAMALRADEVHKALAAQPVDDALKDNAQPVNDALKDDALKDGAQNAMALRADQDHKVLAAQVASAEAAIISTLHQMRASELKTKAAVLEASSAQGSLTEAAARYIIALGNAATCCEESAKVAMSAATQFAAARIEVVQFAEAQSAANLSTAAAVLQLIQDA